jgi:hypothetical protein
MQHQDQVYTQTSWAFTILMLVQWLAGIGAALWISPRTWVGTTSHVHLHVWLSIFLGGAKVSRCSRDSGSVAEAKAR